MRIKINWIQIVVIPVWIYAFIQTWGTDLVLIIVILALKDLEISSEIGK